MKRYCSEPSQQLLDIVTMKNIILRTHITGAQIYSSKSHFHQKHREKKRIPGNIHGCTILGTSTISQAATLFRQKSMIRIAMNT